MAELRKRSPSNDEARYLPLVYETLRSLARSYLGPNNRHGTLQPTALVHEAYLRLARRGAISWQGKTHFLAVAARQMRFIVVERARAARTEKRGGGQRPITLQDDLAVVQGSPLDVLLLDDALSRLAHRSERQAQVVELRLFAGMSVAEVAQTLGVSERTVKYDWRLARAWLARELGSGTAP